MSLAFETRSNKHVAEQQRLLLQAWEGAFKPHSVVYVSGPLTTGPRFLDWYDSTGKHLRRSPVRYEEEHKRTVIEPNRREIRNVAARIRETERTSVVEPTSIDLPDWRQADYAALWTQLIRRFVARIVLISGWQYSAGCAREVLTAVQHGVEIVSEFGAPISLDYAIEQLRAAAVQFHNSEVRKALEDSVEQLASFRDREARTIERLQGLRKDAVLNRLADVANVAQFVSFSPDPSGGLHQEFSRVLGYEPNHLFADIREALRALLENSAEHSINLRSFAPDNLQSRPFVYGVRSIDEACVQAQKLRDQGLHVIANETIDIHDGGVSGVVCGQVLEFAPDDTPRAVEKTSAASLPRGMGIEALSMVYGFQPKLNYLPYYRVEFSIHPQRRGWRREHTLCWELSEASDAHLKPTLAWPNRFSRMIGDKAYGLLVAHLLGLPVPRTTVIGRRVAPFSFGRETGNQEVWIRTCPYEQVPGKYTSARGWMDPYKLMEEEDPTGEHISSVLCQSTVSARFSGAAIVNADQQLIIEGVAGWGDRFMQGSLRAQNLPGYVSHAVQCLFVKANASLGPVRFEWVFDDDTAWIVQLHRGATSSSAEWLVPGNPSRWHTFRIQDGLEALRSLLLEIESDTGILLDREVGLTSHVADLIRRHKVPARFIQ